jgi:alkanesulfonate monooxygenase SsuD/methylene tetrahydromethanopterin reductase-like flavin-dependent oxidoreductase (luciferase family)
MIAADAERHALGGAAGEFRMQQSVKLLAVAGGKRGVERAGETGRGDFVHPDDPPSKFAVLAADLENALEAAKRRCYCPNGQSDYF